MEDYTAKFMDLKTRIRGISDDECLDRYKRGLKPAVRLDVERANPLDLQQAMSHALKADDILFRINGVTRNSTSNPVHRPLPRPAPRIGPIPMEVDNIQRGGPQEIQCHRCRGFGHYAKDCATRQRPGERFGATRGEGRHGGERRHTVTNLEFAEEEVQGREYCGNTSHLPKARTTLPCFKAKIQGRLGLALLDTGATTNFVNRAFLEKHPGAEGKGDSTTICLADGTAREQCRTHHSLTIELGTSITTVRAVEMKLLHFDAILGIPWLHKARPVFDWDKKAIIINDEMVWPIHHVPRAKLTQDLTKDKGEKTRNEKESSEDEDEDTVPLRSTTPDQLEPKFDPTERLEPCFHQQLGQKSDHTHPEEGPCLEDDCNKAVEKDVKQKEDRSHEDAAPTLQGDPDVSIVVTELNHDDYGAGNHHETTPRADDFDDQKSRNEEVPDGGVVTNGAGVNRAAEDVKGKAAIPRGAADQPDENGCVVKRRARRRFRRRPVVVKWRFDVTDRKTSTTSQDAHRRLAAPAASDEKALPDSNEHVAASLPKDHGRRCATGLKARALFIGLAGVLATALLLTAAPNHPGLVASRPARDTMAPATWPETYAAIFTRNACEREQKARATQEKKRAWSPVDWSADDGSTSIHSKDEDSWGDDWPSDATTARGEMRDSVERCPSCGTRTYGWGGRDCGQQLHRTTEEDAPAASNIPGTWARSPRTKRLHRTGPDETAQPAGNDQPDAAQPNDPWAGLVQPHWGGDWTAHLGGQWWTGAKAPAMRETTGTTGGTVAAAAAAAVRAATAEVSSEAPAQGDDPWEPHPWALRVQPPWGGARA